MLIFAATPSNQLKFKTTSSDVDINACVTSSPSSTLSEDTSVTDQASMHTLEHRASTNSDLLSRDQTLSGKLCDKQPEPGEMTYIVGSRTGSPRTISRKDQLPLDRIEDKSDEDTRYGWHFHGNSRVTATEKRFEHLDATTEDTAFLQDVDVVQDDMASVVPEQTATIRTQSDKQFTTKMKSTLLSESSKEIMENPFFKLSTRHPQVKDGIISQITEKENNSHQGYKIFIMNKRLAFRSPKGSH